MEALGKTCAVVGTAALIHVLGCILLSLTPSLTAFGTALAIFVLYKVYDNE